MTRLVFVFLILLVGAASAQWEAVQVSVERDCDTPELLNVSITRTANELDPNFNGIKIIRQLATPGEMEPVLLTEEILPIPEINETVLHIIADSGANPIGLGIYDVILNAIAGSDYYYPQQTLSCADHPYVMRAKLLEPGVFEVCEDIGLLECPSYDLVDPSFGVYEGSGTRLDIFGYPAWFEDIHQCGIMITDVVPLENGTPCDETVTVQERSWSSVKSMYQ